jgi:hypothetical protein
MSDDFFDDLFHGCAFAAYIEQAKVQQDWPDCEATRIRAFALFEEQLQKKRDTSDT